MDSLIAVLIFFLLIGLLEKVLKAASKRQQDSVPPLETRTEEELEEAQAAPTTLQDLIAEQLGISLERRPRVRELPGSKPEPADRTRVATGPPGRRPVPESRREVILPRPQRPGAGRRTSAAERSAAAARERRAAVAQREEEPVRLISLEDRAALERGEATSLEVARRPEDHRRFHERYGVPESPRARRDSRALSVSAPTEVTGRRRGGRLPQQPGWSAVKRAIVWSEILGPPKGLRD